MIGGAACDLLMENEDMTFRATKDIDIVLIVESITAEFGKALGIRGFDQKFIVSFKSRICTTTAAWIEKEMNRESTVICADNPRA